MAIEQELCAALDETVYAFAILDLDTLQAIERRVMKLAQSQFVTDGLDIDSILAKKRVLELLLNHSESNLNALRLLYRRNTRDLWEL